MKLFYDDMYEKYKVDRCESVSKASGDNAIFLNALARNGYPGKTLSKDKLENLCTIGTWDIKENQDWGLDWHRNEGLEITYTMAGQIDFQTSTSTNTLDANMLTLTRPWQSHKLGNPNLKPNKLFWLILDLGTLQPNHKWKWANWICLQKEDLKEFEKLVSSTKKNIWRANSKIENIVNDIDKFIKSYTSTDSISFLAVKINELLWESLNILRQQPTSKTVNPTAYTIELFFDFLEKNPKELREKWTVEDMANRCNTNQTTFFNLSKKICNYTPTNYLNLLRVKYAMNLMKEDTNLSLTEIAQIAGFDSSQYFSTVFKTFTKETPKDFKKKFPHS